MRRLRPLAAVFGAAIALSGCELARAITELRGTDQAALIIFYGDTSRIAAPDTVVRGIPFEVSFHTFGGGCESQGGTEVNVNGAEAEVRPFDHSSGASACTDILKFLPHSASLSFGSAGTAIIRLIGQQRGGASGSNNAPAQLERRIIVR